MRATGCTNKGILRRKGILNFNDLDHDVPQSRMYQPRWQAQTSRRPDPHRAAWSATFQFSQKEGSSTGRIELNPAQLLRTCGRVTQVSLNRLVAGAGFHLRTNCIRGCRALHVSVALQIALSLRARQLRAAPAAVERRRAS
jgi:hypothetical protein